jgi:hypothetical protein
MTARVCSCGYREPRFSLVTEPFRGADDGIRTRDPHLGKVVLYQLSHVRVNAILTRHLRVTHHSGPGRAEASLPPL